ncbi:unnamed protein product [Thelazia callipaeda]|uniref:Conserved oligomeric Golgi complex subunit 5 n=1 Tax=Thelazia callipaeda TaxID=103827 RepID=A0A0N5D7Z2_THECL|nr:unnamed protein product [Thelazia callipaeda]
MEANLEDCIWGRFDWNEYIKELVGANRVDEEVLIEKINSVKESVGRQIRKAVEQHHPRLVEQASALQNLDRVQAAISHEMSHLTGKCEELCQRFQLQNENLRRATIRLEQLYLLRRVLSSANRCEQLVEKLKTTNELVKRSEIICELEAIKAEVICLKDLENTREMVLVTIPKLAVDARQSAATQLRSSLESLSVPLVSSCVRALKNLSSYDSEVNQILQENIRQLDSEFLQLSDSSVTVAKFLPQLINQIQMSLEQYSLLSVEVVSDFSEKLAFIISRRIPENAAYVPRFVQFLSKVLSAHPTKAIQPLDQSLQPLRRAILSHSLNRMFKTVEITFEENSLTDFPVENIDSAIKEELKDSNWDPKLRKEMEANVGKVLQLVAQKIEQHLSLDSCSLQMGERLSALQIENYTLISMAHTLALSWPSHSKPLIRISQQAEKALLDVARSSVFSILASMHKEELNEPSPYVKELCDYLRIFHLHAGYFLKFAGSDEVMTSFLNYVIELFLMNSSLLRPISFDNLCHVSSDLQYISDNGLSLFSTQPSLMLEIPQFVKAFRLSPEELSESESLPFWFVTQLLISMSEETLLSPHVSAGWTIEEYLRWSMEHGINDRLNFFSSLMHETKEVEKKDGDDDEWEEKIVVLEIIGLMDVDRAKQALNRGDCVIRRCETENPIVQIGSALFTAEWDGTVGTDMIFKVEDKKLCLAECADVRLKAEKALITSNDDNK